MVLQNLADHSLNDPNYNPHIPISLTVANEGEVPVIFMATTYLHAWENQSFSDPAAANVK